MKAKIILILISIMGITASLSAQERKFGFELNSGVSFPTSKIDGNKLNTGFGFEFMFHFDLLKNTGIYAGWGWNRMSADNSFAGKDIDFEETGYIFGLQYRNGFSNSKIGYFLRLGGLYNHIESENENDIVNDTKHGLGWQTAAGLTIPISESIIFTPLIKFNSLNRNTEFGNRNFDIDYNYLSLRIGFVKRF